MDSKQFDELLELIDDLICETLPHGSLRREALRDRLEKIRRKNESDIELQARNKQIIEKATERWHSGGPDLVANAPTKIVQAQQV